jgi:hypothetical protein
LERAASVAPADSVTARALLRLLVAARRDTAALAAARRYAAVAEGPWGDLLEGFAWHALGDDTAAAVRFRRGIAALPERERRRLRPEHLVSEDEGGRYKHLPDSLRVGYEAALWKLADPLYLTPGNEVLTEHWARYVWGRMLAEVTPVAGMVTWGEDLEELTFRYGVPQSRERVPAELWEIHDNYIEHFDSIQRAFLPESLLTMGVREVPEPGSAWTLADARARSGYAPRGIRRDTGLAVQVTRFPVGDSVVLRVDGALALDSIARESLARDAGRVRTGLYALRGLTDLLRGDTAVVRAETASVVSRGDTARLAIAVTLPAGAYVFSAEALEPASGLAAQARYAIALLPALVSSVRRPRLTLSDILLARALAGARPAERGSPALRALSQPIAAAGDTLGLYAEVTGLDTAGAGRYYVALELRRAGGPPPRLLGVFRRRPARVVRMSWIEEYRDPRAGPDGGGRPGAPAALTTDLALPPGVSPGLYELVLQVTKPGSEPASATRLVRIRKR